MTDRSPKDNHACLFVMGCEGTALEVLALAKTLQPSREIHAVRARGETTGEGDLLDEDTLGDFLRGRQSGDHGYIMTMRSWDYRERWLRVAAEHGLNPESVIHPRAVVAEGAKIGAGCYLAANAVVSNHAALGDHCTINYNVVVGHHAQLGEHVMVNPGAAIGGHAQIGARVLLGANAFVAQGRTVGAGAVVDALTYVDRDLEAGALLTCRSLLETAAPSGPVKKTPVPGPVGNEERASVLEIVNRVLENNQKPPVAALSGETSLRADLGFDSLLLAELAVHLEMTFGVDVFREGLVTTIGEVEARLAQNSRS